MKQIAERHHWAKLRNADIPVIREKLAAGLSLRSIGREYGVDHATIRQIRDQDTWKSVA